ncbi:MAG: transcriptional regulator [Pseudomonadales bacterium]|jgi:HTH-type transcriptional regulator/antitoxin HigA|nr:transcriptional regulator [Pseudomonadales bacterium]
MGTLNIEKVNQSFTAFRMVAGLDDYDRLVVLMNALADSGEAGEGGKYESLFLLLADLLEAQDKRHYPMLDATPAQVLRFLMEQHALNQSQLPEIGNQSVVSQVLNGKRQLNVRQIARLCQRFGVGAELFIARDVVH